MEGAVGAWTMLRGTARYFEMSVLAETAPATRILNPLPEGGRTLLNAVQGPGVVLCQHGC